MISKTWGILGGGIPCKPSPFELWILVVRFGPCLNTGYKIGEVNTWRIIPVGKDTLLGSSLTNISYLGHLGHLEGGLTTLFRGY